jgi:predicted nuclease of predicted toxin-antitoxin system
VKFLLDHDVPAAVKDALERHEHDIIRLTDLLSRTASDETVFAAAQGNQCVMSLATATTF